MEPWIGACIYGTLAVIVAAVLIIIIRRRRAARAKYAALTEKWRGEGYARTAVSPAGAVLFQNESAKSLIVARENTDRFTVLSYGDVRGFAVYDDDFLLVGADVGSAVCSGDTRVAAKKARRRKSECFRLILRRADGETDAVALTQDVLLRESREYDEARRMADRFVSVLLAIKEENERDGNIVCPPPEEADGAPAQENTAEMRLLRLRELRDKGLISKEQYNDRASEILKTI